MVLHSLPLSVVLAMKITRLQAQNFKSFDSVDIELGDLNIFIGPTRLRQGVYSGLVGARYGKGLFPGGHKQATFRRRRTPIMDSQHSTDTEETPTARTLRDILDGSIDAKLRLIRHHAKMARLLAEEVLGEEVASLAGERHSRKEDGTPFRRWGSNSGSIRIDGERISTGGASRPRHRRRRGAISGKLPGDEKRGGRPGVNEATLRAGRERICMKKR